MERGRNEPVDGLCQAYGGLLAAAAMISCWASSSANTYSVSHSVIPSAFRNNAHT